MKRRCLIVVMVLCLGLAAINPVALGQPPVSLSAVAKTQAEVNMSCELAYQICQKIINCTDEKGPSLQLFEEAYNKLKAVCEKCQDNRYIEQRYISAWKTALERLSDKLSDKKQEREKYKKLLDDLEPLRREDKSPRKRAEEFESYAKDATDRITKARFLKKAGDEWEKAYDEKKGEEDKKKAAWDYYQAVVLARDVELLELLIGDGKQEKLEQIVWFIRQVADSEETELKQSWLRGAVAKVRVRQYKNQKDKDKEMANVAAEACKSNAEIKAQLYREPLPSATEKDKKMNLSLAYHDYIHAADCYHTAGSDDKAREMYKKAYELVEKDETYKRYFSDAAIKWAELWLKSSAPVAEAENIIDALKVPKDTNEQRARDDTLGLKDRYDAYEAAIEAQDLISKFQRKIIDGAKKVDVSEKQRKQDDLTKLEQQLGALKRGSSSSSQLKKKARPKKKTAEEKKAKKIADLEKKIGALRKELAKLKKHEEELAKQRETLDKHKAELAGLRAEQLRFVADQNDADLSTDLGSDKAAELGNKQKRCKDALQAYEDAAKKFEFIGDVESSQSCLEEAVKYSNSYLWSTSLVSGWEQNWELCREAADVVVKKYQIEERLEEGVTEDYKDESRDQDFIDQFLSFFDEKIGNDEELLLEHYALAEKASRGDKNAGKYYIYLVGQQVNKIQQEVESKKVWCLDEEYKKYIWHYEYIIKCLKGVPPEVFESMPEKKYRRLQESCEQAKNELLHRRLQVVRNSMGKSEKQELEKFSDEEISIIEEIKRAPKYILQDFKRKEGEAYERRADLKGKKDHKAAIDSYEKAAKAYRDCGLEERAQEVDKKEIELWIGAPGLIEEALAFVAGIGKDSDKRRVDYFAEHISLAAAESCYKRGNLDKAKKYLEEAKKLQVKVDRKELAQKQKELEQMIRIEELERELGGKLNLDDRINKADELRDLGRAGRARDEYSRIYEFLYGEYRRIYRPSTVGSRYDTQYYTALVDLLLQQSEVYLKYVKCGGASKYDVFNMLSQNSAAPLLWNGEKYTSDYWRKMGRLKANIAAIGEKCSNKERGCLKIQDSCGEDAISKTYSHSWQAFCMAAKVFFEEYDFLVNSSKEFKCKYDELGADKKEAVKLHLERYVEIMSEAEQILPDSYELSDKEEADYMWYVARAAWNLAKLFDAESDPKAVWAWDVAGKLWLRIARFYSKYPEKEDANKAYLSTYIAYYQLSDRYWCRYQFITLGWNDFLKKYSDYPIEEKRKVRDALEGYVRAMYNMINLPADFIAQYDDMVYGLLWAAQAAWNLAVLELKQRSQGESLAWTKAGDLWRFLTEVNEKVDSNEVDEYRGPYNDGNEVQKAAVNAWSAYINATEAYNRQSDPKNRLKMIQKAINIDVIPDDKRRDKWIGYSKSAAIAIEEAWQSSTGEKDYWRDAVKAWQQLAAEGLRSGNTELMDTASAHLKRLTEDVEKQSIGSKNWKNIKTEIKAKCEEIIKETKRSSAGDISLLRCRAVQFQLLIVLGNSEFENYMQYYGCLITAAKLAQTAQRNETARRFYEKALVVLKKMTEISAPGKFEQERLEVEMNCLDGKLKALPEGADLQKSLESIDRKPSNSKEGSSDGTMVFFKLPYVFADVLRRPEHKDEVRDSKGDSYWVNDVRGDGNCFFRAVADQLGRQLGDKLRKLLKIESKEELNQDIISKQLRQLVDKQINEDEERFEHYNSLEAGQTERLRNIGRDGVWSSDAVVQALADLLGLRIKIVHLENSLHIVEDVELSDADSDINLTIGFTGNHFVSLLAAGEEFTEVEKTEDEVAQEKSSEGDMHYFYGERLLGDAKNPDNSLEESVRCNQEAAEKFTEAAQIFGKQDRVNWRMCRYKYAQARYFEAEGRFRNFDKVEAASCYDKAFRVFCEIAKEECDDEDEVQNGKAWAFWMAARTRVGCAKSSETFDEKKRFNVEAVKLFNEAAERFGNLDEKERMRERCVAEREKAEQEAEIAARKSEAGRYSTQAKKLACEADEARKLEQWQKAAELNLQASCLNERVANLVSNDTDQVDEYCKLANKCKAHAFWFAAKVNIDKAKNSQDKQLPNEQAYRYYLAAIELFEEIEGKEGSAKKCRKELGEGPGRYVKKSEKEISKLELFSVSKDKVTLQGKQSSVSVASEGDDWYTAGTSKGKKGKKPDCYLLPDPKSFMPEDELGSPSSLDDVREAKQKKVSTQRGSALQKVHGTASGKGSRSQSEDSSSLEIEASEYIEYKLSQIDHRDCQSLTDSERNRLAAEANKWYESHSSIGTFTVDGNTCEEFDVPGVGNCMFHAIAHQLRRLGFDGYDYIRLRQLAAEQINANLNHYRNFDDPTASAHDDFEHIGQMGVWGGHIALQALADYLGFTIVVVNGLERVPDTTAPNEEDDGVANPNGPFWGKEVIIRVRRVNNNHYHSLVLRNSERDDKAKAARSLERRAEELIVRAQKAQSDGNWDEVVRLSSEVAECDDRAAKLYEEIDDERMAGQCRTWAQQARSYAAKGWCNLAKEFIKKVPRGQDRDENWDEVVRLSSEVAECDDRAAKLYEEIDDERMAGQCRTWAQQARSYAAKGWCNLAEELIRKAQRAQSDGNWDEVVRLSSEVAECDDRAAKLYEEIDDKRMAGQCRTWAQQARSDAEAAKCDDRAAKLYEEIGDTEMVDQCRTWAQQARSYVPKAERRKMEQPRRGRSMTRREESDSQSRGASVVRPYSFVPRREGSLSLAADSNSASRVNRTRERNFSPALGRIPGGQAGSSVGSSLLPPGSPTVSK